MIALFCASLSFSQFSFNTSVTSGCAPLAVNFTNTSTAGVHYNWDFGDGTTLTDVTDASHLFLNGGTYTITMFAEDASFTLIGQAEITIEISGEPEYIAMISNTVCINDTFDLAVYVPGAVSFDWDFDDGYTATGSDYQQHSYAFAGEYHPTVTINTASCGVYVVEDTVTVLNTSAFFGPTDLSVYNLSVCPNEELTGSSNSGYQNYAWDFGDGNTDNGEYVNWSYSLTGGYIVTHTVTNGCGVDTVMTESITVNTGTPVTGSYIDGVDSICPGEDFSIWSNSNNGIDYAFDMGDGSPIQNNEWGSIEHSYASVGSYLASVTITNDCGNTDVQSMTIVVTNNAPVQNVYLNASQTSVCPGDLIEFYPNNSSNSFYIDYGDGAGSDDEGFHSYDAPGTYIATLTEQNSCGNSGSASITIEVLDNLPVNTLLVNPDAYPMVVCPGQEIEFNASQGFATYSWDFGDGGTSVNQNSEHIYNSVNFYNVNLTVENGCGNSATVPLTVQVAGNLPAPDIGWQMFGDTICPGDAMFFFADEDDGDFSYLWDFGDGSTSTNLMSQHFYNSVGTYPIELNVTNGCGNDTTFFDTLIVASGHSASPGDYNVFAQEEGCISDEMYFVLMPAGMGSISWDFGDGNSSSDLTEILVEGVMPADVVFHSYTTPGTYWATYSITNACGNTLVDSVEVLVGTIGDDIDLDVGFWWDESQTSCQGQPVEFTAVGGASYIWNFGDGTGDLLVNSSLTPVYHTFADPGNYLVTVTSYNQCGVSDDSDENIFIPQSQMDVSTNTVIESNCGDNNGMAIVSAVGGTPPYTYSWTSGDSGVIADSLSSGVYTVTVTDNNGCSNEGIATVSDEEGVTILVDNVVDVNCYGNDNGSISVTILGGAPPYNVQWSNGDQTEDIFGLQAGPYEIFVTDANGCFAVQSIQVNQPEKTNLSVISMATNCENSDGSAVASVNNGTPPYNYIWPNATGPSNQTGGLSAGTYTLLVIDGNTCLLEQNFVINESDAAIILTDSTVTGTCNGTLSSIYLSTIGGTSPFNYTWSDGSTNEDLTGVIPGDYEVEIEGANGCSAFAQFTVVETQPEETNICMVDVDSITNTNLVVWVPLSDPGIDYYNIYKETSEAGLFLQIGQSDADSISQYFDYLSDPSIRSWSYKVSAVDDCGNEADLSDEHKTIHLTSNQGINNDVNLIWDHYSGFSYPTYYINRYHPSTGWEVIDSVGSNLTSYTDDDLPGDSSLVYMISIVTPSTCTAYKATDYNSSRSNKQGINMPDPVEDDSGVDELNNELTVYPNPTSSLVKLIYTQNIKSIEIFDIGGKLVYENRSVNTSQIEIDLSHYQDGIYNFRLTTDEKTINGKVIKN